MNNRILIIPFNEHIGENLENLPNSANTYLLTLWIYTGHLTFRPTGSVIYPSHAPLHHHHTQNVYI